MLRLQYNFLVYLCLALSGNALAAEHFMATTGSDSNSGSKASPWFSLQESIWKLKAGDTLTIRGGTYYDASFADISVPSTGKTSVIRAAAGEQVVFDGRVPTSSVVSANRWKQVGRRRWSTEYIGKWRWLDGLWLAREYFPKVDAEDQLRPKTWFLETKSKQIVLQLDGDERPENEKLQFRLGFMITFDTPNWRIEGITANYFTQYGIGVWKTRDVVIRGCQAHFNGGGGIEAVHAGSLVIEDNHTSYNGSEGGPGWSSGIHLFGLTDKKSVVRRNISHHNRDSSDHHTDGNGFSIDKGYAFGGAEAYENIAYNNGGRGLDVMETADAHVHHNTFYNNSLDPEIANQGEVSIYGEVSLNGLAVSDNILLATRKNFPLVVWGNLSPAKVKGDYNLLYNQDSAGLVVGNPADGENSYTLEQWQRLSGNEMHSLSENPKLKNPDSSDFAPRSGSPVFGKGSKGGTIGALSR